MLEMISYILVKKLTLINGAAAAVPTPTERRCQHYGNDNMLYSISNDNNYLHKKISRPILHIGRLC